MEKIPPEGSRSSSLLEGAGGARQRQREDAAAVAGHTRPGAMQRLPGKARWKTDEVRDETRAYMRLRISSPVRLGCRGAGRFRVAAFALLGRGGADEAVGRQRAVDTQLEMRVLLAEFVDR